MKAKALRMLRLLYKWWTSFWKAQGHRIKVVGACLDVAGLPITIRDVPKFYIRLAHSRYKTPLLCIQRTNAEAGHSSPGWRSLAPHSGSFGAGYRGQNQLRPPRIPWKWISVAVEALMKNLEKVRISP